MFGSLGMPEILVIAAIALLIFGPKQLPKLGKSLGETIKEVRNVHKELTNEDEDLDGSSRSSSRGKD